LRPGTILLLTLWIGLAAGFLDLAIVVFQARLITPDFYRLGHGFPWIIPAGVAAVVLVPGVLIVLVAAIRRGAVPRALALGLPAFVALLDLCARLPLELWASLLLSVGLTVQYTRFAGRRIEALLRVARLTAPLLAGTILVLALATSGVRAWSEHRAIAALPPPPPAARNVLLIVWDTVRAQNLSLHGYFRPTTPNLERFAAAGTRFQHAFATSPWTLPAHASLFTGRWPHELSAGWRSALDGTYPTLAEHLRSLGYDTAGFVANLDYCGRETGLERGFTHYEDYPINAWEILTRYVGLGRRLDKPSVAMAVSLLAGRRQGASGPLIPLSHEHAKRAEDIDRAFLDWLSWQRDRDRPFFAFLNYNDAHTPYEAPDESAPGFGLRPSSWSERITLLQWNNVDKLTLPMRTVQLGYDLYDDSIAHLDKRLGALLDELGRRGVLDETLVIVTSDHGEHLGDHRLFFHGCSLYRQLVQVPLVMVDTRNVLAGRTVDEPVSLRDLPATVLDLLGLEGEHAFPGRSLTRFWAQGEGADPPEFESEPLLMETEKPPLLTNQGREPVAQGPMKALVAEGMHYIRSGDGREELFSLKSDPQERFNVAGNAPAILARFRALLQSVWGDSVASRSTILGSGSNRPARPALPTQGREAGVPVLGGVLASGNSDAHVDGRE
jgi:arylsulfatase A-like enzyme